MWTIYLNEYIEKNYGTFSLKSTKINTIRNVTSLLVYKISNSLKTDCVEVLVIETECWAGINRRIYSLKCSTHHGKHKKRIK